VIDKLALAHSGFQFENLLVAVAVNLVGLARLDAGQNADQPVLNVVVQRDVSSMLVLANLGRLKIFHRSLAFFRRCQRGLDQSPSHGLGVFAKIFQQYTRSIEIAHHAVHKTKHPQVASKYHSIPPAECPRDFFVILLYKLIHGIFALVVKRRVLTNKLPIIPNCEDTFFLWLRPSEARPRWAVIEGDDYL